ncbi:MAG: bifunctional metallophosphatase/5'-nucleotidase [Deltaproteobacteria bacterium]|nr:bifunctional metallophosphatase/5'-nucleotidase [Deltaproteobacteria bacterium]MCW5801237.1 bifunctional metallophosphatase/5'-nucleotidase [Deltaproteobacteria bacterium]
MAVSLAGCTVERAQPNLVGQDIRLTLIHTSDIHSRLFPYNFVPNTFDRGYGLTTGPYGGIARIATVAKQIRRSSARSLWLDTGDCFQGAPVFNMFRGEAEMRALSLAGMDGAVLGNHEFDLGARNLFDKIDNWGSFPIMAANYAWDDPPPGAIDPNGRSLRDVIPPFEIYDVEGLKVGVIGMGNTSTITSIYEGGNNLGFRPIADEDALDGWVRLIRPSVDVVVVISHLGLDEDEDLTASQVETDPNQGFKQATLAGVDVILGGHLHIVTNPPKVIPNDDKGHSTVLVHSGAFAKFVGRLDLVVHVGENNGDPETRSRVTSFSYTNLPVDSKKDGITGAPMIPDDVAVASLMWPYSVKINQEIDLNGVFAYVNPKPTATSEPAGAKITRNDLSGGDSQLGNLVARSMQLQEGVEAEFAITNSLGIRADFEQGPLTIEQMFNVFPFENSITVVYLSGIEVQETLDYVASRSASRGCRTQAQVSGIAFDMVCGGPSGAYAKNVAIGDRCRKNNNPDGEIDFGKCAPLIPTSLYRVAVNDYIAAGGSGFQVLKRNTSKQDTGISLRDSLRVFLNRQNRCVNQVQVNDPTNKTVAQTYGAISCLDHTIEAHDGRIRPVFE